MHGLFLRVSIRLADVDLVLPAFVSSFSESKFLIAVLPSLYYSIGYLPQTLFANYIEPRRRKKTFLYVAIITRTFIWFALGALVFTLGNRRPGLLLGALFFLLLFYVMAGSLGGVALTDIIGKAIDKRERGRFYAAREMFGSLAAFGSGYLVKIILDQSFPLVFPRNYGLIFFLAAGSLLLGIGGFYLIKEPRGEGREREPLSSYLTELISLLRKDPPFRLMLLTRVIAGFHIMIIPYYIVFFREVADVPAHFIGFYIMARVFGGAVSNFLWGRVAGTHPHRVIQICLLLATVTPLITLLLEGLGPEYYTIVFVLVGSGISARMVGFQTYLLELAPKKRRPTYSGMQGTTIALTAPLPFLGAALIENFSYQLTFALVSAIMFGGFLINLFMEGK